MSDAMVSWQEAPLGELADIAIGGTPSRDVESYWASDRTDGFPWVAISDLHGRIIRETKEQITTAGVNNSNVKLVTAGTVLMSFKLSLGRVAFAGRDLFTNEAIAAFKSRGEVAEDFLFYILPEAVRTTATDVAIKGATLNKESLKVLRIPYPCKAVQQRIATILSGIDTAIEKTEALIAKYQQIKAGLMHDLFTRGVLPNGQLRPPREQAPELYQETAIGWIPKEWSLISIGTAFDIQLGKMLNQDAKTGKSSFPYVGNRSVQWDRVDLDALEEMDFSPAEREKFSLKSGDLLVCEGGDVGRTAIWDCPLESCYYQKAIHRLRPKGNQVKPRFMLRFMWYAKNTGHFDNYTSQTSIAHLTQEKLASVPMAVPSIDEQDRLIARFDGIDSTLDREQDFLANLRQQKSGLMHDLLTGKVPVKVEEAEMVDG